MIGVVAALSSEAEILLEQTETFRSLIVSGKQVHVGRAFGKDVAVVICGVGKVNAALGTQLAVSKFDADKLFNFGVAGGLNKTTELCGVYQIKAAVQFDFDLTQLNGTKIGTLDEYKENYLKLSSFRAPLKKKNLLRRSPTWRAAGARRNNIFQTAKERFKTLKRLCPCSLKSFKRENSMKIKNPGIMKPPG